jgi:hypothetical protein
MLYPCIVERIIMKAKDAIKKLIEESDWNQARLSNALGFSSPQAFDNRRKARSPKTDFLVAILGKLNYQLVIVPDGSKLPKGAIVIDDDLEFQSRKGE